MPVAEDPAAGPTGRVLLDGQGRALARFRSEQRHGRPLANFLIPEPDAGLAQVVAPVMQELSGHAVATTEALGEALLAAGAIAERHAHNLVHDLKGLPPVPPADVDLLPAAGRGAQELVAASLAAYGPGHPDFRVVGDDPERTRRYFADILGGRTAGPLLPCSLVAADTRGCVLGAALVTRPHRGPSLVDLFREPGRRGLGTALLVSVMHRAAADGLQSLSLTVTEGNPARGLYDRLGFRHVVSFYDLVLP